MEVYLTIRILIYLVFIILDFLLPSNSTVQCQTVVIDSEAYSVYSAVLQRYSTTREKQDDSTVYVVCQIADLEHIVGISRGLQFMADSGGGWSLQERRRLGLKKKEGTRPIDDSTMTQIAGREMMAILIAEFTVLNKIADTISPRFHDTARVLVLSQADRQNLREKWRDQEPYYFEILRREYPRSHGEWQFSNVAFDEKRSFAFVYVDRCCNSGNDASWFVLLRKSEAGWIVVKDELTVVY